MPSLLIIEDEGTLAKSIARYFEHHGWEAQIAASAEAALKPGVLAAADAIVLDFNLPGMNGLEAVAALRAADPRCRIVMLTGQASVRLAVDAMKAGASDFLTKPVVLSELKTVLDKQAEVALLRKQLAFQQALHAGSVDRLLGNSAKMVSLRARIRSVARIEPGGSVIPPALLISGETGSGKELVALACHAESPRAAGPFVEINCAAIPATMLESELFGHERGAFTDARERKIGLIEAADGGTLFLDEVGEIDIALQSKLLKVLDEHKIRRLGGVIEFRVNVRVIAATNRSLRQRVHEGLFRADLLHRLNVIAIEVAPLRERRGDVTLLAGFFLGQIGRRYGKPDLQFTPGALKALKGYEWPGNVRQLRNTVEQAVLVSESETISEQDIALPVIASGPSTGGALSGASKITLELAERELIEQALIKDGWNISKAARALGVSRPMLRYRIRRHGLTLPTGK